MSATWLYEDGIGEARAALVAGGRIIRARIEPDDAGPRVGAVLTGVLTEAGRHPRVTLATGDAVMLNTLPPGISTGRPLLVEIVRERLQEGRRVKLPRAVVAAAGAMPGAGPSLWDRISASGVPVRRLLAHEPDALEAAGWSEVLEEAVSGDIAFPGGVLRTALTPAMTLFDVDGDGPADALALAAASAVAAAIIRHGIGGSIGVDFPTVSTRAARMAIDAAVDAAMAAGEAGAFERTAVNGFGFLQIIRPRPRASLPESLAAHPDAAAARAALRRLEREPPPGPATRPVPTGVARWLRDVRPDWVADLNRRTGNSAPITDMDG